MSTETATPSPEDKGNHAERLLRAQAAELEALRARVADLPDPDTMASWRASHERLSELQADLPTWREQLQAAHQAERARLESTVQQQQQALADAALRSELQTAFLQGGGNGPHFDAWRELAGKNITRGEDGALLVNGKPVSDALSEHRQDSIYGVFFHPRYGSGGGAKGGFDGRVSHGQDLHSLSTSEKFTAAFARRGTK